MAHIKPALFGELRSLLQQPPNAEIWQSLIHLFERHDPAVQQAQLLPYTLSHLESWPDDLRCWQSQWSRRFMRGKVVPVAGLSREVLIKNRQIHTCKPQDFEIHNAYMLAVRSLRFIDESHLSLEFLKHFWNMEMFRNINNLAIQNCAYNIEDDELTEIIKSIKFKNLKRIEFFIWHQPASCILPLITGQIAPELEEFHIGWIDSPTLLDFDDYVLSSKLTRMSFHFSQSKQISRYVPRHKIDWSASLKQLKITHAWNIVDEHIQPLFDFLKIANFSCLDVLNLKLEDRVEDGLEALSQNPTLQNLKKLELKLGRQYPNTALNHLLKSPHLSHEIKQTIRLDFNITDSNIAE